MVIAKKGLNKNKNASKNKNTRFMTVKKIILLSFLSLLFLFLLLAYLFITVYRPSAPDDFMGMIADFGDDFLPPDDFGEGAPERVDMSGNWNNDCYTFLILGRDEGLHTDTMMLAMFNVRENTVSILNIPRDTYVTTKGFSGKITNVLGRGYNNAIRDGMKRDAAMKAGIDYLKTMIRYTFGVPVQFHIMVDLKGFKFLVDEIDGVEMYVPQDMFYSDPEQGLYINLKKGTQTLDGSQAEQVVRYRSGYASQDIGRIETQQKFLAALTKKLLRFDLKNINALFETGSRYMETNISTTNAAWFAQRMLQVKLEDMRTHTLPGVWIYPHQVAYKTEAMEIINKYYNPFKIEIPESNFNIDDKGASLRERPEYDIDGTTMAELLK